MNWVWDCSDSDESVDVFGVVWIVDWVVELYFDLIRCDGEV